MRARVAAAGGDPGSVPDEEFHFLRLRELEKKVGLARSSIYRRVAEKTFPAPITLG
jgi:predicted DNA-binding transcriptional regulator AlpA